MPLPMSGNQVDKLSARLRHADSISDDDHELLLQIHLCYQKALDEVQQRLGRIGYSPTSRTKTTSVLVGKLRREGTTIKRVQDIAGARIVADCDRDQQDEIVQAIAEAFAGDKPPKIKDRRKEENSHGYRAVHIIVTVQDLPVEIQVRTHAQDMWAQIVESLADRWGRGIRYGEPPPDPDRVELGKLTRGDLWLAIAGLSEQINQIETLGANLNELDRMTELARVRGVETEAEQSEGHARQGDIDAIKKRRVAAEKALRESLSVLRDWAR